MKIDIKPAIIYGSDYHEFLYFEESLSKIKIQTDFYELEGNGYLTMNYSAIFWLKGAEDELFEFIFTNQRAWEALTEDEE